MNAIWKFPLEITGEQNVMMPEGATILAAQMQGETACPWALVNPGSPFQRRTFNIVGTGHPFDDLLRIYIGTIQMHGGSLVWHIFEKP